MKKNLLLVGGLLAATFSSQAQLTNCGLGITTAGTGQTKTYTLSVPPTATPYTFYISPNTGVTISGTGLTKTATYTYGGTYGLSLSAANCSDTVRIQDIIVGPMNCAQASFSLSAYVNPQTRIVSFNTYGSGLQVPGYTSSVVYDYGDGTSGTSNTHIYANSGPVTATATMTYSHPQFPACTSTATTTFTAPIPPCNLNYTKSGSGLTRTYTALMSAPNAQFSGAIRYAPSNTSIASFSTNSYTHTYTQPGYYQVELRASTPSCIDTIRFTDTVAGPLNCSALTHSMTATHYSPGDNFYFRHQGSATHRYPGYTTTTTYNYGDGTTGTSPYHTYAATGNFLVTATTLLTHPSFNSCTIVDTVTVRPVIFNCANVQASFTYSNSGSTYTFNNTSTPSLPAGVSVDYFWYSSAGFWANGPGSKTFTFTQNGTYNVALRAQWRLANGILLCQDSVTQTITVGAVPPPPSTISTWVAWDSTVNAAGASVKLWLIQQDSAAQTLTAVDSALIPVTSGASLVSHNFNNRPAGSYRVKAHMLNQPSSWTTGFLPTYATNAAYWNNATVVNHSGPQSYASILLQQGAPMTGPGFIGGSISQGANKGAAGDPMPAVTVLLRNAANKPVTSTQTDSTGHYSFSNVPTGKYSVFPEELNYATTPASVNITTTQPSSAGIDFLRQPNAKTIHPVGLSVYGALAKEGSITISPNPAQDRLTIQFATAPQKGMLLQLFNLSGQQVRSLQITDAQPVQHLNLSGLASGNYLLHVGAGEGKGVYQIHVQP